MYLSYMYQSMISRYQKVNAILELNHGTDEHEYAKLEKCSALNEDIKKITV